MPLLRRAPAPRTLHVTSSSKHSQQPEPCGSTHFAAHEDAVRENGWLCDKGERMGRVAMMPVPTLLDREREALPAAQHAAQCDGDRILLRRQPRCA